MTSSAKPALDDARRVADAVLYEGYLLYPYRASSSKNQVRWQFGMVGPQGAELGGAGEASWMSVDCLIEVLGEDPSIDIHLRFLQTQWRSVERATAHAPDGFEPVDVLRVGDAEWISWHEAVEQEITLSAVRIAATGEPQTFDVVVAGGREIEVLSDATGRTAGRLIRRRWPLVGRVRVTSSRPDSSPQLVVTTIRTDNLAFWSEVDDQPREAQRDLAAQLSFVGTHLLLAGEQVRFVSVVDPPSWAKQAASGCGNSRSWPVLAGGEGEGEQTSTVLLCSPIILGDHPAIAEQSPGQLFDSAEIDEILTLRIMTMTEDEKAAARGTDPRAAEIISRSDAMPPEIFERLHGALRGWDSGARTEPDFPTIGSVFGTNPDADVPWFSEAADAEISPEADLVMVDGLPIGKGARVVLRPKRRADAHDMFLAGQVAVVQRIDLDVDGEHHVAVLLEDDPASELHEWHGRYYYFGVEELEPLSAMSTGRGGGTT